MLNRRGFLKGIFGAVALIAAAPALRVPDMREAAQLEARMGLAVMRRVQIEGPHDNAQWGYQPC